MIYTHAAALLLGLAAGFVGAWNVQAWRHDAAALEALEQARETERMRRQAANSAAGKHEESRERIRTEFVTITERVTDVVKADPVVFDRECVNPDGLRALGQAARSTGYAGKPFRAVSAPESSD